MEQKLKIFVSAYACEPGLGSEIGVGWHWVLEMSKYFELWVLTRESNRHTIEPWIAEHPEFSAIHFLYFDLPKWARFWKRGLRGVRMYYNIWQIFTNGIVRRTMVKNDIRVFHHLTYGNVLWKVSTFGQKQFFVWGPVGGLETVSSEFSRHYSWKSRVIESLRRFTVGLTRGNAGFRKRCRNADLILCKTDITRSLISEKYREKAVLFTDVAAGQLDFNVVQEGHADGVTEYITVGRLDAWRGFDLVIEGFARAYRENKDIHLTIVGKGADKERLKMLIKSRGVESAVTMTGSVTMEKYYGLLGKADVVVNGSLKEGAVTVSFDTMAMGKPLICLDTTGYTRYFNDDYSVVIPVGEREAVISSLTDAMLRLTDADERRKLGAKAMDAAGTFTWENRGREIRDAILQAYKHYSTGKCI